MAAAAAHVDDHHDHHGPPEANRSSRVEPAFLGMLLFIISEVMIFGAFFTAYFFIRVVGGAEWPAEGDHLPKLIAGFNTAILISSSFTIHFAQESIRKDNRLGLQLGMVATFLLGLTFLFVQINEYVHVGFSPQDSRAGLDLLRAHRPARRARDDRPDAARVRDDPGVPRPLLVGGLPRHGSARDLLALRRRDVDRRLLHGLHHLMALNPLRTEREAFRFLLYVLAVFAVAMVIVLVVKAL